MGTINIRKKALILAAGLGTRLAPLTDDKPKSLVAVNGVPILIKQLENLFANQITDVTVVSGYMADVLEKAVHACFPTVHIVESRDYAVTNNMYSAYLGMKAMFPEELGAFYMMNADVFFDASVITALAEDPRENLIVVDSSQFNEESMKVVVEDGHVVKISKQITKEDAYGCSIDVYKFGTDGSRAFFDCCADYIESRHELKKWSEVALDDALRSAEFFPCPLVGRWYEIDNHDDLRAAEELFK